MLATLWLERLLNPAILGTVLGCAIPIVWIVCEYAFRTAAIRSENELIRSMVDRGMSVEEIERILAARAQWSPGSSGRKEGRGAATTEPCC